MGSPSQVVSAVAHRKPLGSVFSCTFDWRGEAPSLNDFLVSQADTWYRVVGVEEKANPAKVGLVLERIEKPDSYIDVCRTHDGFRYVIEENATIRIVFEFEWYERKKRRA